MIKIKRRQLKPNNIYLADKFNTSRSNIYCIIKRINWKHI